jgi:hypothetical protein
MRVEKFVEIEISLPLLFPQRFGLTILGESSCDTEELLHIKLRYF